MAREVVTRRTVLHHYCSTRIRFEPPTQSVTYIYISHIYIYIYIYIYVTGSAKTLHVHVRILTYF